MKLTDENGNVWNVLAQRWDGEKYVIQPERVMIDGYWHLINYIVANTEHVLQYPFNMNDTVCSTTSLSYGLIFPPEEPIPA